MSISNVFRSTGILILLICQVYVHAQSNHADFGQDHYCNKVHSARNLFNPLLRNNPLTENYDLKYYRFEWEIDPAVYAIKGKATPYFKVVGGSTQEINMDLSSALTIDSIVWHGQKIQFTQPASYQLNIKFPQILNNGVLDSLSITYHGVPPSGGFGSFIQDKHGEEPILWTLSEPFGAQDWWPCKNGLDDKIDSIDVIITTLEKYRAASNGTLVAEKSLPGGFKSYHWKHRYAITPYLVAIAVTNYAAYTDDVLLSDGKIMPMLNYVYPENLASARSGTAANVKALQFYDSLFVAYPFRNEKYGHAQFGWGGGMEHQTMSFVINYGWGLLAHELAHQWFGDFVTCGDWRDIWLNEGFATYLEGLSRERFPQAEKDWYNWKVGKVNSITSNSGGSVKVDDPTNVNRIFSGRLSYNKGSYLLHMLRWKLGDDHFFQGLRNYLNDRAYNYAITDDLKTHLEDVSGQDLEEYFNDWFAGQGYPTYQVGWDQDGDKVGIRLKQTTSHPSVSFFEMPVPVRLYGQGKEMMLRLDNTTKEQVFEVSVDFIVQNVEFDPQIWLAAKSSVVKEEDILSSVPEQQEASQIRIYPNPANEFTTLHTGHQEAGVYMIYDTGGKLIMTAKTTVENTTIDIKPLKSGKYFVKVGKGKKQSITELIKVD